MTGEHLNEMRMLESINAGEIDVCRHLTLLPIAVTGREDPGGRRTDKGRIHGSGQDTDSAQIMAMRDGGRHSGAGTKRRTNRDMVKKEDKQQF